MGQWGVPFNGALGCVTTAVIQPVLNKLFTNNMSAESRTVHYWVVYELCLYTVKNQHLWSVVLLITMQ